MPGRVIRGTVVGVSPPPPGYAPPVVGAGTKPKVAPPSRKDQYAIAAADRRRRREERERDDWDTGYYGHGYYYGGGGYGYGYDPYHNNRNDWDDDRMRDCDNGDGGWGGMGDVFGDIGDWASGAADDVADVAGDAWSGVDGLLNEGSGLGIWFCIGY